MSEELNKETVEEVSKSVETTESSEQPAQEEKQISPEEFLKDLIGTITKKELIQLRILNL